MKTEILKSLMTEIAANGYPIQDLQPDGEHHSFPLSDGGKGFPAYLKIGRSVKYRVSDLFD